MKVAVIGAGSMGGGIARGLAPEHDLRIGSRTPEKGSAFAAEIGASFGGSNADAVEGAEVVFLTVPWVAVDEILPQLGNLDGVALVDVTNPYVEGELKPHEGTSDAELIQAKVPGARVVKGWNTVFSPIVNSTPDFDGVAASVFLAGDDGDAKAKVSSLARDLGYDPVDSGPLENARSLERLMTSIGALGHSFDWGSWALRLVRR